MCLHWFEVFFYLRYDAIMLLAVAIAPRTGKFTKMVLR